MLIDGLIIKDGMDMVGYLDGVMSQATSAGESVSGIIISSNLRTELTRACHKIMNVRGKEDETVNRFRGALLIEDGANADRLEVIKGRDITMPVDTSSFGNFGKLHHGR